MQLTETQKLINSLTKKQREAFEAIAIGQYGGHDIRTLRSLAKKGLIEQHKQCISILTLFRYSVPLYIHIEWCKMCANDPNIED